MRKRPWQKKQQVRFQSPFPFPSQRTQFSFFVFFFQKPLRRTDRPAAKQQSLTRENLLNGNLLIVYSDLKEWHSNVHRKELEKQMVGAEKRSIDGAELVEMANSVIECPNNLSSTFYDHVFGYPQKGSVHGNSAIKGSFSEVARIQFTFLMCGKTQVRSRNAFLGE